MEIITGRETTTTWAFVIFSGMLLYQLGCLQMALVKQAKQIYNIEPDEDIYMWKHLSEDKYC